MRFANNTLPSAHWLVKTAIMFTLNFVLLSSFCQFCQIRFVIVNIGEFKSMRVSKIAEIPFTASISCLYCDQKRETFLKINKSKVLCSVTE